MDLFNGFNFTNLKDFEVSRTRQKAAAAMFCDLVSIGYDPDIVYQYLLRYVSCLVGNYEVSALVKYRDRMLRACGTPFPESSPEDFLDLFTNDLFDFSLNSGKFLDFSVYDESKVGCLFDPDNSSLGAN